MPPSPQLVDDYWVGLNQVELNPTLLLTSFVSSVVTAWECLLSKMGRKFMWRHTGVPLAFLSFLLFIFRLNKKIKNWYILPNFGYSVFHICSIFPVEQAVQLLLLMVYQPETLKIWFISYVWRWQGQRNDHPDITFFLILRDGNLSKNFFSSLGSKGQFLLYFHQRNRWIYMYAHMFIFGWEVYS